MKITGNLREYLRTPIAHYVIYYIMKCSIEFVLISQWLGLGRDNILPPPFFF